MGVEPPFIYDKPATYTFGAPTDRGYNPKAVTHASWSPKPQRPKQDGPLVDFNKHPDSYVAAPYGNLNAKPMSPRAKSSIKWVRWVQLLLRVVELAGAVGTLIAAILVLGMQDAAGWIIRIPVRGHRIFN